MTGPPVFDRQHVGAARLWAARAAPYLASALFACTVSPAPDSGTIAVDESWRIRLDPALARDLPPDQLGRLMLHLVGHVLRNHAERARSLGVGDQDASWWNRCADAELNDDLREQGLVPPLADDLPADLNCPDHGLTEQYFRNAPAPQRKHDCGSGADGRARAGEMAARPGQGESGDGEPGLSATSAELVRLSAAQQALDQHRREPGSVPAGFLRWARSILPSRTDWRRVLAAEIRGALAAASGNVDYSYRRPSRRAAAVPSVVLPRLYRPVPEVAIVCDTSGSMDGDLLARAVGEIDSLLRRAGLRPERVRVLAVDAAVQVVQRTVRAERLQLSGGGGTDMGVGIAAAVQLRPRPDVIIVLTDGFTPWPTAPVRAAVVVGLLETGHPSPDPPRWIRVVRIPAQDESR
jgi:predicted metal-dependent peptidase